jgi:hypothetical protein
MFPELSNQGSRHVVLVLAGKMSKKSVHSSVTWCIAGGDWKYAGYWRGAWLMGIGR